MDLKLVQRLLPYAAIAIITTLSLWSRRSRRCRAKTGRSNDSEDGEAEASSIPSSSPPPVREDGFQYHVFLSFRGLDTRKTFTDLLYEALKDKGIITFIDSEKLEKGQKLEDLLECIQKSKIFVPIFSRGYADSKWCLKEIAKMVECKRVIVPVFVDVEPTDVRGQTGPFGSAFRKHRKNKAIDEVEVSEWSNALTEAAGVSGYTLATTNGYQGKLIQQIVKRILNEVNKTSKLVVAKHPVGLDSRILDVMKMLESEAQDDVRMVGICGMGGIGKTTLSTAVYNEISSRFDACSFISNVREAAERPSGLVSLQKQLLGDVFNEKDATISDTNDGLGKIKERIGAKKVLLVLDDVNNASQINELVGQLAWFRSGSRIIITTRDTRVLTLAQSHVYELKGLDDIQSLELFSWHAFGKKEPDAKFADLSKEVASTAAGLPLALTIFGSHFFDLKTDELWRATLKKLKEYPDTKIHERLRISFDVLDKSKKEIFLDIACFFVGQETKRATLMWEACGFFPGLAINCLIHKSLVSINDKGEFEMHDHVQDMGRKIVQAKAQEAGKYSRLWNDDETVLDVLQNKRGTEDVEAIELFCEGTDSVSVDIEYLAAMSQLRMLLLQDVTLKGGYEHFPRKLRWLKWSSKAMEKFPSSLHLDMIVVLDLSGSLITQLCDPQKMGVKVFNQLKVLDLSGCQNFSICPDFASMIHLQMLSFHRCVEMSELHPSIGHLKSLTNLNLRGCESLKELPQEVWQLTSLQELDLFGCKQITALPSQIRNAGSLKQPLLERLNLSYCRGLITCPDFTSIAHLQRLSFIGCEKITKLDPSIGQLKRLMDLDLSDCKSLKELPQEIGQLTSLKELTLRGCSSLKEVPQEVWQLASLKVLTLCHCSRITALPSPIQNAESLKLPLLEILDLGCCSSLIMCPDFTSMPHLQRLSFTCCEKITKLDPSIGQLKRLMDLDLSFCNSLKELPQEIGQLTSLEQLTLIGCSSLKEVPQEVWQLTSLQKLTIGYCHQITTLPSQIRNAESLKLPLLERLDMGYCRNLIRPPDFTSMPHLQELCFIGCEKMTELDPSIGQLKRLMDLDLMNCKSLKELPQEVWQMTSLQVLNLSGCRKITALPSPIQNAESLKQLLLERLDLQHCSNLIRCPDFTNMPHLQRLSFKGCEKITELDPSIGQLKRLMDLDLMNCKSLKELPQEIGQLISLEQLTVRGCSSLKEVLSLPPSLNTLKASDCHQLESMADVSNLKGLEKLDLKRCVRLEDIPGIEQSKCLNSLFFEGCRKLVDSLFERVQEANFQHLLKFSIPGRLINDGSSDPQSIAFILPKQFRFGLLCLYVDQRSMDNIWSELKKSNGTSTLPDKSVASEDEVTQPVDSHLGRSIVRIDITTNDAHFSFTTFFNEWDSSERFPMATFARYGELMMMMAYQGRFKGNDVDDAQGREMTEMCVSIDSCVLLHGDLRTHKWTFIDERYLDPCQVGHNIVYVKFG